MNRSLAQKISLSIGAILIGFALAITAVFFGMYRASTIQIQQNQLRHRGLIIVETIEGLRGETGLTEQSHEVGRGGGYGAYLRFISEIAGVSAWVVDTDLRVLSDDAARSARVSSSLPESLRALAKQALAGELATNSTSDGLLKDPILSISAPIRSADGDVMGAVVLRTIGEGTRGALGSSLFILVVSIIISLAISFIFSIRISRWLVRPLRGMTDNAKAMAGGDYTAIKKLPGSDEVAELSDALSRLAETLDEAQARSAQFDTMRAQFISNISHELRTPLTVMRGSLEALRDNVVTSPAKVEEFYQQLLEETRHLERLVSDLFELAKMEDPGFEMVSEPINVRDVVVDTVRSAVTLGASKGITVETEIENIDCMIMGDYGRFRQMLLVLIDNAIKYSPVNSTVWIRYTGREISIADQGPGLSEKEISQLFERFYRARYGVDAAGTGLGLSIAKQIALRHSTTITVDSDGHNGAIFTVHLSQN